jgi:hypothetical protein
MTLDQIIEAERQAGRVMKAIRSFTTDGDIAQSLNLAELILSEVRHYAVSLADIRNREREEGFEPKDAAFMREEACKRLAAFLEPQPRERCR